jgi:hypothetical protein
MHLELPCAGHLNRGADVLWNAGPRTVLNRTRDQRYAISYAERHAYCLQLECATECGL